MSDSFIETSIVVDDSAVLDPYSEVFQQLPDFVAGITASTVNDVGEGLLADLRREPGPPQYPLRFASVRQRRFVMAQRRAGAITGERSHDLANAWKLEVVYDPNNISSIQVSNDDPAFPFVEGANQQPYNADTGWQRASDTIQAWTKVMRDAVETDVIKSLYAIGEPDKVNLER